MSSSAGTIDHILFAESPTMMQPRFGPPLAPPEPGKHRFVVAQGGLYLEARNEVLAVRLQIAPSAFSLPYGTISQTGVELIHGPIPYGLLSTAIERARTSLPNEWAGLIVWDMAGKSYRLYLPEIVHAGTGTISYRSALPAGLLPVVDVHSHGPLPAFFSETDDYSDLGGFYLAMVLGRCDTETPEVVARLVVNGHFLPCHDWIHLFKHEPVISGDWRS